VHVSTTFRCGEIFARMNTHAPNQVLERTANH
jgi:hypothetical protein